MAGQNSGRARRNGSRPLHVTRALLSGALRHTIQTVGCSRASAARWLGIDEVTLRRWLGGKSAMRVETVLRSTRLGEPFLACARIAMHKLVKVERRAA